MAEGIAAFETHNTIDRDIYARALQICEGRVEDAAKMLGLSRKGLYLKRHRLGLE